MKKLAIIIILALCSITGYSAMPNVTLTHELDLHGLSLDEALSVISRDTNVSFIAEPTIKDTLLQVSFPMGENLSNVIPALCTMYNLKVKQLGKSYLIAKKSNVATGEVTFSGKITNNKNAPMENVSITLLNSDVPIAKSTHGGNFIVRDIDPGVYIVKFEKDGYTQKGELIDLSANKTDFSISLDRDISYTPEMPEEPKITYTPENNKNIQSTLIGGENYYTEKIKLLSVPPEEIKEMLESTYADMIRVTPVPKANAVIIFGTKEIVDTAREVVHNLDGKIQQVRVSSQILDVSNNLFEDLGFDWVFSDNNQITDAKGTNASLLKNGVVDGIGTNYTAGLNLIRQFNSGKDMLSFGINMLQSTQDLVISALPSILIADGEQGEFKITEEVIVGEEKNENDNTSKTTYTPLFREAGIILNVTPIIQEEDSIVLKIKIEVSNFKLKKDSSTSDEAGTYNSEGGSKVGRSIETVVKMHNGETIFIGGLKKAMLHSLDSRVPYASKIPLFGNLFKNKSIKNETTDIYIRLKVDLVDREHDDFQNTEIHRAYQVAENRRIYTTPPSQQNAKTSRKNKKK